MANDEDGKISIGTKINTDEVDSGLKKISNKLNAFARKLKSNDFANLGMSITGIGTAFNGVTKAVKVATAAIQDVTNAYKNQLKAETQLEVAVKNNPFLDASSVRNLKDYASEMQNIAAVGDEQLLPLMAELAASGRSQAEIQDIISASLDLSASGVMSLDAAVSSLNLTYSGSMGQMARYVPALKNLNEEQLRNGEAINIIKKNYNGMAKTVADNVGGAQKLSNAWGDLKEQIGAAFNNAMNPMQTFFAKLIQGWADAAAERRKYENADKNIKKGQGSLEDYQNKLKADQRNLKILEDNNRDFLALYKEGGTDLLYKERGTGNINAQQFVKEYETLTKTIDDYKAKILELEAAEKAEKDAALAEINAQDEKNKKLSAAEKSGQNYESIIKQRDETIRKIKQEAEVMNEEVDQQAILNAEITAYLDMAGDPLLVTKTREQKKRVEELAEAWKKVVEEKGLSEKLNSALDEITLDVKKSDLLKEQLLNLDTLYTSYEKTVAWEQSADNEKLRIAEEYTAKRKKLAEEITKAEKEETEKQKISALEILDLISSSVSDLSSTLSKLSDMVTKNAENNAAIQTAALEKQYADGKLNLEEYNKEKLKIEKESARKQYEMQMWEWSANLLQIGANTAAGIARAWAENPWYVAVPVTAMIGTSSSVQLAAAIANKPVPPRFAHGGIVPGNSYSGDRVVANVNSGEMILNAQQQAALWAAANGSLNRSSGGGTMNVSIKNYRGNDTTVSSQLTERGLELYIRKTVADSISKGKMNAELMRANNSFNGIRYES